MYEGIRVYVGQDIPAGRACTVTDSGSVIPAGADQIVIGAALYPLRTGQRIQLHCAGTPLAVWWIIARWPMCGPPADFPQAVTAWQERYSAAVADRQARGARHG